MRNLLLTGVSASVVLFAACGGDEDQSRPTATPSAGETRRTTPSSRFTATATSSPAVTRPNADTLLPAEYVLDQSIDVSLDGSETGQIVVISHTIRKDKAGNPVVGALPEECPVDPINGSPCAFRSEVFSYDEATGWASLHVDDHGNRFAGAEQGLTVESFPLGGAGRDALIITSDRASGTGSGTGLGLMVLSMEGDEIQVAYASGLKASVRVEAGVAVVTEPHFADADPGCCPSGQRITRVGLDAASGEVRVLDEQIVPLEQQ